MRVPQLTGALLALLAGPCLAAEPPNKTEEFVLFKADKLALTHVELIDGSGAPPRKDQTVIIENGVITAVGEAGKLAIPKDAKRRDLSGYSLTPGFVMLHEHWFYPVNNGVYGSMFETFPSLYLAGGTTTLRTAGSVSPYADLNTWTDIREGKIIGPDMDVTAPFLNGKEAFVGQMHRIKTPEQAARMVNYWADE